VKNKIFINRGIIAANKNHGMDKPPITVEQSDKIIMEAHEVKINGPSAIVYKRNRPLTANQDVVGDVTCWIETDSEIIKVR
tara:strand:- start:214 stop:456 length:243 start_codon:yes stop_codon:yes gene_type:complete